jgi:hypothetical protein
MNEDSLWQHTALVIVRASVAVAFVQTGTSRDTFAGAVGVGSDEVSIQCTRVCGDTTHVGTTTSFIVELIPPFIAVILSVRE